MRRISNEAQMKEFREERALISVFVHHAYRAGLIEMVLGMRKGFDYHVRQAWHMMIPYVQGDYAVDAAMHAEEYGGELARRIIEKHGLQHKELPALIFEFVPDTEYFCVKLGGKSEDEIEEIIGTIGDMAVDEYKNGPKEVSEFRENIHTRIAIYLRQRKLLSILSKAAPKMGGILAAANDAKGLFD
ncbi:hypothetical protein ELG65_09185 [Rhizobium leguminosarum]|uniref:hypothetical protein n=1 Tax=Rhizobium leguminosarum TaxID=384 RepID=UPI0010308BE2|nr:hypothetical protein [Rhizobium leguminosarum]TBH58572.1 hypothetical protein ELG65_09185 [Rhizobium leguminosarum]